MELGDDLPLFPLGDVVLLPGGMLPLHVFEPRYCEMVRDTLGGARLLGIARLRPGFEGDYLGRPPIYEICGAGRVVACEDLPHGRFNILVQGIARVRICEEKQPHKPYRIAQIEELRDAPVDSHTMRTLCDAFLTLCRGMVPYLGPSGESLCRMVRDCDDPRECLDMVAAALVRDPDARQTLLETVCPATRAHAASAYVAALLARLRDRADPLN